MRSTQFGILLPVHHKHFSMLLKVQTVIIVAALNTLSTLYKNLLIIVLRIFIVLGFHKYIVIKELHMNYKTDKTLINQCV